eukprot:SAG22_NODE_10782_length_516_cov_0.973621_1_plen_129_part_01
MAPEMIYVSLTGKDEVAVFERAAGAAGVSKKQAVACPSPGALAVATTAGGDRVLFVGTDSSELVSFAIDPLTGELRCRSTAPAAGGAQVCTLTADKSGRWLFTAAYGGGCVAVYSVTDDGALSATPVAC